MNLLMKSLIRASSDSVEINLTECLSWLVVFVTPDLVTRLIFLLLQYLRTHKQNELVNSRLVKVIDSYEGHSSIDDRFHSNFSYR